MSEPTHTPGPWKLCFHLEGIEKDQSCSCGYRGGIWGPDGEHLILEMGCDLSDLSPRRYDRKTELANARLIAAAPDLLQALLDAEAGLEFAGADVEPPTDFIPTPTLALRAVRAAIQKATKQ